MTWKMPIITCPKVEDHLDAEIKLQLGYVSATVPPRPPPTMAAALSPARNRCEQVAAGHLLRQAGDRLAWLVRLT